MANQPNNSEFKKKTSHKVGDNVQNDEGSNFLITEYQELSNTWKHTDARIESSLRFFLGASTILVSAIAIAFTQGVEPHIISYIILFGLTLMTVIGTLIMKRILGTSLIKDEYLISINLIRGYFKDRNLDIEDNLLLPSLNKADISDIYINDKLKDRANRGIIIAFQLGIGVLTGLSTIQLFHVFPGFINPWNWGVGLPVFGIAFLIALAITHSIKTSKIKAHKDAVYERVLKQITEETPPSLSKDKLTPEEIK